MAFDWLLCRVGRLPVQPVILPLPKPSLTRLRVPDSGGGLPNRSLLYQWIKVANFFCLLIVLFNNVHCILRGYIEMKFPASQFIFLLERLYNTYKCFLWQRQCDHILRLCFSHHHHDVQLHRWFVHAALWVSTSAALLGIVN